MRTDIRTRVPALAVSVTLLASVIAGAEAPDMRVEIERYDTDRRAIESFYAPAAATSSLARLDQLVETWNERLAGIDFGTLDQEGRVDYVLLANHLRHDHLARDARRARLADAHLLVPLAERLMALESSRRSLASPSSPRDDANMLQEAAVALEEIGDRIRKGLKKEDGDESEPAEAEADAPLVVSPVVAMRAARLTGQVRGALQQWFEYRAGYEPAFGWWVEKPYRKLVNALEEHDKLLREEVAGADGKDDAPLVGDPIGREALLIDLAHEMIPYSPEELLAIGEREFAWCEAEMATVAKELGFASWKEAVEHVKSLHAPPGGQTTMVVEQAREAIRFVQDRGLLTIDPLCTETWRLEMISGEGQRTLPYAAYSGQRMLVAYPTEEMEHESKLQSMRGNNRHFSRIVTPHELIPGHHLQGYMAARHRAHRGRFRTPFLVEGWALYWEMRLWDLGWARGPEDRVGMLFWRSHRCARIIVSLGFHLGAMEPDDMIDYLVERVGHERDAATSEVRRYISGGYGPLYQCAYMIGGLQLLTLHRELVETGDWSEVRFHDEILRQGSIPIALIRAALAGHALSHDGKPTWRFAE